MVMAVTGTIAAFTGLAAGISVMSVAAAVAAVGVDLTVVGLVTKDPALEKIGGVMALGGGAVGLMAGSGLFDAAAATDTAGTVGAASTSPIVSSTATDGLTASSIDGTAANAANIATNAAPAATSSFSLGDPALSPTLSDASTGGLVGSASPTLAATANPASTLAATDGSATPLGPLGADQALGNYTPWTQPVSSGVINNQALNDAINSTSGGTTAGANPDSWLNSLDAPTKALVMTGIAQTAGSALGGLGGAYSAQQQLTLDKLKNSQSFQKWQVANSNANTTANIVQGAPRSAPGTNLLTTAPGNGLINSTGGVA